MPSHIFSEAWAELAGSVVVSLLWQATLIGVLVTVAFAATRGRSPNLRYALACVGLLLIAALLPANFAWLATRDTSVSPPATQAAVDPSPALATPEPAFSPSDRSDPSDPSDSSSPNRPARPQLSAAQWYHLCLPWLGRLWAVGIVCFALYDLAGLFALRRLRAKSQAVGEDIAALARRVQERLGVHARVQVRWLAGISSALVTGFFRTVILLPASMATRMTPDEIEAILAHEFAHIRRWDLWVNAFQRVVEALLFFHPVVWWLSKTIRAERELCCDELALRAYPNRAQYVRALLTLAETAQQTQALALSSHGGNLVRRVRSILLRIDERNQPMQGRMITSIVALTTVVLPLLVAFVSSVSSAQELPERVLYFPEDRSVGTVQGRWAQQDYGEVPWRPDHNAGWTNLGDARGLVTVPENVVVKLTVAGRDLSYLLDLDPDAVFYLDCRFKELTNDDVAPIAALTGLRALDLSDNPGLTGEALGQLGGLQELEWLDFDRTPISDLPPGAIEQFPNLRYIAGHFQHYADDVLRQLGGLPEIEYVCIKAGVVTADGLRHLGGKSTLRGLVLDNVELTDEALAALDSVPNLVYLDLRKNPSLTDEGLRHLAALPNLTHLNLEKCQITDIGVAHLVNNRALQEIYLSNTPVTEASLVSLSALPALQTVKLVETSVTEAQAAEFTAKLASRTGVPVPPQQSSNPDAPKVGIVMSHFTATGPHRIERPYGYSNQVSSEAARAFDEANYDVYAVIEPGTQLMGELPGILRENGLTDKTVDGFNPNALGRLDAIFLCGCSNMRNEMLEALDVTIQQGVGLIYVGTLGTLTPGESDPAVEKLTGLQDSLYTWQGFRDSACPVIERHPILGDMAVGSLFNLNTLNGSRAEFGTLQDATVLIDAPADYPDNYPVLYVRNHGQGRIVGCQWHRPLQPGIPFPGYTFYIRALNWAAHRDPDAVW
ncbi:MAG: M48 family metalloprotease [Candidatus Hydrogenedentes bacterium]|nr:M48 family metalloprotease [Candidatus Hydrogenedentota bacterium]